MNNDPNQRPQGQPPFGQPSNEPPTVYGQPPYGPPPSYGQPPYGPPPQGPYGPGQQAPYGQPQSGPYAQGQQPGVPPYYNAEVPQKKKSRKGLWITLGIIGGVLVLGCAILGVVVFAVGKSVAGPTTAIVGYYEALKVQNYPKAYSYLDPQILVVQGQTVTPDLYAKAEQIVDTRLGTVSKYTVTNVQTQNDSTATLVVQETRNQTRTITYSLRKIGNDWKITANPNTDGNPPTN